MRLLKERVWRELHERVMDEELIGKNWTVKDSDIFNSFPFKLLCEKVEELEDSLKKSTEH
jgi:hypothetical protein